MGLAWSSAVLDGRVERRGNGQLTAVFTAAGSRSSTTIRLDLATIDPMDWERLLVLFPRRIDFPPIAGSGTAEIVSDGSFIHFSLTTDDIGSGRVTLSVRLDDARGAVSRVAAMHNEFRGALVTVFAESVRELAYQN